MDLTHLHLVITHLPIYGTILGILVLLYGFMVKSSQTRMAAYFVLLLSAIGGIIAFSTGEAAEDTVKKIEGISRELVHEHEEFAEITIYAVIAQAVVALGALWFTWKKSRLAHAISIATLLVALTCFTMTGWTGYLGGQIRHSEISK